MTTAEIATIDSLSVIARKQLKQIEQITQAIKYAQSVDDVQDVRARAEALKGWAKVHGRVQEVRLELLQIEVAALVRVVELGGADQLPPADRKAALWLSAMSEEDRNSYIRSCKSATTVAGMCRSAWREQEIKLHRQTMRDAGIRLAEHPTPPPDGNEVSNSARRMVSDMSTVLANILEENTSADGVEFSIDEMADELIEVSTTQQPDPLMIEGVREVCRRAVRSAPPKMIDGTVIPRVITARTSDGSYVRIPWASATVAHLQDMVDIRKAQLEDYEAAFDKLNRFYEKILTINGSRPDRTLGELIEESIQGTKK